MQLPHFDTDSWFVDHTNVIIDGKQVYGSEITVRREDT